MSIEELVKKGLLKKVDVRKLPDDVMDADGKKRDVHKNINNLL